MMEKIVVLSHEAGLSATNIVDRIKTLTGIKFTTTTDKENNTVVKYGCTPDDTKVCLCVGDGAPWRLKYGSLELCLTVSSVKYDKRIFKPGELVVELTCHSNEDSQIINKGIVSALKAALYDSVTQNRSIIYFFGYTGEDSGTDIEGLIEVCSKYYVHDFTVTSNSNPTKVVLNCYSLDNLLTLDKYSKVYCGDTFNGKLFNGMENHPQGLTLDYNVKNLVNTTKYNEESGEISEIRFPFLVQYNESFYDFLRRIAVRCGEYLYHDEGKLTLGINEGAEEARSLDTKKIVVRYPNVALSNTYGIKVNLVPSSSLISEYASKSSRQSYNMEYTNDDFQRVVGVEDNDAIYNKMYAWEKFTYGSLGAALTKATSAETAASAIMTGFLSAISDAGINRLYLKGDFEDEAEKYADSVGLLPTGGLMNSDYYTIEKNEEKAQKNTVELDYSSAIPKLYLGNAIDLGDGLAAFYTVTHVYGEIAPDNVRCNKVEVVPSTVLVKTHKTKIQQDGKEVEVLETSPIPVPIPPHYDIPRIRKAEAQEAVVKDVKDPYLLGRVRVKFLWQADPDNEGIITIFEGTDTNKIKTNFSPWLRVTVPYVGGNQGGMNMMPELNDHLMVNFVGGNVDMPYIEGFMATRTTMPSSGSGLVKNKLDPSFQRKVIASAKGHSITFTDITDKSSLLNMICPPAAAIANMVQGIGKLWCGKTDSLAIDENWAPFTGGITLRDPNGVYELDLSAKTRSISVKSPFGNVNISAFTGITIDAPNGDINIRGKNVNIEAGNNLTLTSGTNIRNKDFSYKGLGLSALAAGITGGVSIIETAIGAAAPWTKEIAKLADVSFLRSTWEIIVRPVEGSLKLQSKRNTIITAGNSKVAVPKNTISDAVVLNHGKFVNLNEEIDFVRIFRDVQNKHDVIFDRYLANLCVLRRIINNIITNLKYNKLVYLGGFKEGYKLNDSDKNCFVAIFNKIKNNEKLSEWSKVCGFTKEFCETKPELKVKMEKHNKCIQFFNEAIKIYKTILDTKDTYVKSMKDLIKSTNEANESISTSFLGSLWDDKKMFGIDYESNDYLILRYINNHGIILEKIKTKRKLLYNLIESGFKGKFVSEFEGHSFVYNPERGNGWDEYVSNLKFAPQKMVKPNPFGAMVDNLTLGLTNFSQSESFGDALLKGNYGKLINYHGIAGPRSIWGTAQKGQILVSNNPASTMLLSDDSDSWVKSPNPDISAIQAALGYTPSQQPPQQPPQQVINPPVENGII